MLKNNMLKHESRRFEPYPFQNETQMRSFDRFEHCRGIAGRCQAALDAPLGFLHLLGSDILRFFGHVRLMLGDIWAVSNGHAHSNLEKISMRSVMINWWILALPVSPKHPWSYPPGPCQS